MKMETFRFSKIVDRKPFQKLCIYCNKELDINGVCYCKGYQAHAYTSRYRERYG